MPALMGTRRVLLGSRAFDPFAYTKKVLALTPIAYWPCADASGSAAADESGNARDGVYGAAKTLGVAGIGDGRTAVSLPGAGATNFINLYSAGLAGAFNGQEGSLALWAQVLSGAVWADATSRFSIQLFADANNRILLDKTTTTNQLRWRSIAGGTTKSITLTTAAPTSYQHLALTWSKGADQVLTFLNGAQVGTTQTGNGTWAGALSSTGCYLGATDGSGSNPWKGQLAHAAIWNRALSGAEVLALSAL